MEDFKDLQEQSKEFWPNILYKIGEAIERHENRYHKADRVKFNPPTLEEIKAAELKYCKGKEFLKIDCEDWRLYWEGAEWKRNKRYISWRPTLYRWIRKHDKYGRQNIGRQMDYQLKIKEKKNYNPCL